MRGGSYQWIGKSFKVASYRKAWHDDAATPLFCVIGLACFAPAFYGGRIFWSHPDVMLDKDNKKLAVRDNERESVSHRNHWIQKMSEVATLHIPIFGTFDSMIATKKPFPNEILAMQEPAYNKKPVAKSPIELADALEAAPAAAAPAAKSHH